MLGQRLYRDILGRFTTGVVLITAQSRRGPVGMAVNSFTSVALDPPLVAWCAGITSTTWPDIRATGAFAVTILGDQHEEVCRRFSARGVDRFAGRDWAFTRSGHPMLPDGLGWLDCRILAIHPAGDHEIVLAEAVDGAMVTDGFPLVFHAGRFTGLASVVGSLR